MSVTENRSPRRFRLTLTSWIFAGMKARGDIFVLSNTINICHLLSIHPPQWCRQQDAGNLFPPRPFIDFNSAVHHASFLPQSPSFWILTIDPLSWLSISLTQFATCFRVWLLSCYFVFFRLSCHFFRCSAISALNMTKRVSITASRDLRMASEQEMDLPMTLITAWITVRQRPDIRVNRYPFPCRFHPALRHQISRHTPLFNQLSGAKELSIM